VSLPGFPAQIVDDSTSTGAAQIARYVAAGGVITPATAELRAVFNKIGVQAAAVPNTLSVALAAATAASAGGGGGGGDLVFDPGGVGPTGSNVFTDFAALFAAFQTLAGFIVVFFPADATVPAGAYDFGWRASFRGPINDPNVVVTLAPGVSLARFGYVDSATLVNTGALSPVVIDTGAVFVLDRGGEIRSAPAAAPLVRSIGVGPEYPILAALTAGIISAGAGPDPSVTVDPGAGVLVIGFQAAEIQDNAIVGALTSTLVLIVGNQLVTLGTTQSGFLGTFQFVRGASALLENYVATTPADWSPAVTPVNVNDALDLLASRVIAAQSPTTTVSVFEDWISGAATGSYGWLLNTSGTGSNAVASNQGLDANHQGILMVQTGSTATGRAGLRLAPMVSNVSAAVDGELDIEWLVQIENLATAVQDFTFLAGLSDLTASGFFTTNAIMFVYIANAPAVGGVAASANWQCVVRGGVSTTLDSGVAVVAGAWIHLKVQLRNGTGAEFFIDGVSVGTVAQASLPGATSVGAFSPVAEIEKRVGTTQRRAYADYMRLQERFGTAR
jgi:hypothetical protein